ncbi:hypothetical protein EDC01DRAFT_615202 [Geopyxis carbonaria]|nr:hypothetical protein EDC01DRAFT_615202 [Geopyxis carbonaria]
MKRSYEDSTLGHSPSINSPTGTGEARSPIIKKRRSSKSPSATPSASLPPVASLFTDASGRITRIPTISRKVRACAACKKQKIRCDFEDGEGTCVRCKKMKLECVVNRSLQTILDEDVEWKHRMREDTVQLQHAVEDVLASLNMRPLNSYTSVSPGASRNSSEGPSQQIAASKPPRQCNGSVEPAEHDHAQHSHRAFAMAREQSHDPHADHEGHQSLFSSPMGSLYEVTRLRGLRNSVGGRASAHADMESDFVARGVLSLAEAQELFEIFREHLNHYLYSVALVHDDLDSARASSSLLSSAIFTVTALHVPQHHHLFPTLYQEFLALVSNCMFERHHRLDDVRGLCIGAFWLMEISWKLSGHAVRIATEMNIHQSFRKALDGSREHFERARLWYLLYVCDHHFSIAYGRPPVIHDHEPHRKWELYLQSPMATEADSRVLSQVSLFVVMTRIHHFYADECENEISEDRLSHLPIFNEQLENWRNTWTSRLSQNNFVGDYPSKGVDLHYHFARLQLNSLALRGASPATIQNLSTYRKEHANMAITSARTVLSIILEEPSIRESLVGVPLYINTMVAFAAVFLLKVTAKWKSIGFNISSGEAWDLVERVIVLLNSRQTSESHIIPHVAAGLEKMMHKCQQQHQVWQSYNGQMSAPEGAGVLYSQTGPPPAPSMQAGHPPPAGLYEVNGQYYPMHMGVFDFLSPQLPY